MADPSCIFCKIAAHQAPAEIVYDDGEILGFRAIVPATPLHVLVIPKRHVRSLADLDDEGLAGRLVLAASRIAKDAGHASFRVATNSGAPEQTVFHLHVHVMAGARMGHPSGLDVPE